MRLLRSRLPNLLEFGLSRSTPTVQPSLEGTGSVLDHSCYTSHSTDYLCRCRAIDTSVKTREPPAPCGTRLGCKSTGVPEVAVVYRPLYMFRP